MTFSRLDLTARNRLTISATGEGRLRGDRGFSGFSLVEILLVVALIGVMASVFVINFDTLIRQNEADSLEQAFWQAASEARNQALFQRRPQDLRYDPEANAYTVGAGGKTKHFKVDTSNWKEDIETEVLFKQSLSDDSYRLVAGQLITQREIPLVRYYPDGTSMPFVLEIRAGDDLRSIEIDPWSGAELLAADDDR